MTTPVSQIPTDFATTKHSSFQHFILLQSFDRSSSLDRSPQQEPENESTRLEKSPQSTPGNALFASGKRRMASLRNKGNKKSGTILHAVPETTTDDAALLYDQRDTAMHACQDVSSRGQSSLSNYSSRSPSSYELPKSRSHSRNSSVASPVKHSPVGELRSVLSNSSLKSAIGVYKHGRIQWRQNRHSRAESETKKRYSIEKKSRPQIRVVIPNEPRERPLPTIPFLAQPCTEHIVTAARHLDNAHDVSPPSGSTRMIMRNSVVSPLNQAQPIPFGQFQRSMSRVMRKSSARTPKKYQHASKPSTSSIDSHDSDSASTYSNHSSETSVEDESPPPSNTKNTRHYSVLNPITAGVFETSPETYSKPPPRFPPRRYAHHHPPIEQDHLFEPTCLLPRARNASGSISRQPTMKRKSTIRLDRRRSLASTKGVIDDAINRTSLRHFSNPFQLNSPTLSEAVDDLEEHLSSMAEDAESVTKSDAKDTGTPSSTDTGTPSSTDSSYLDWHERLAHKESRETIGLMREDSTTIYRSNMAPPVLPRKSSKRQSAASEAFRLSRVPGNHIASQIERSPAQARSPRLTITIPEYSRDATKPITPPVPHRSTSTQAKRIITPTCAEGLILAILRSVDHLDDLFATAVVNRGFYSVFKRNELELIKSTLRKMSPPAWEFREIAFPGHDLLHDEDLEMTRPQEEYTPGTYTQLLKRDVATIKAIKSLIKERCQTLVRPETATALISNNLEVSARIDDALWRIWTFCKIFGSGKGREEDIVAQQDWLRGGVLVHQKTCTFSIVSTEYMNDILVRAPECFAKGNEGGLSAEQLFDMMELWTCLGVLLQGLQGLTAQAREYGFYDNTEIRGGDIDGEETMLDEWCYYLQTFGLSTVLSLHGPCRQKNATPFKVASQNGWDKWTPPLHGGSRRNFLKEAASRVYEDKIARKYAITTTRDINRQMSKARQQQYVAELYESRNNNLEPPVSRLSQERPMSEWSTVIGNLTRPRSIRASSSDTASYAPTTRSALAQELTSSIAELPACSPPFSPPRRTVAQPLLPSPPPSTVPSVRDRSSTATMNMPPIHEHPLYNRTSNRTSIPRMPSLSAHPAFRNQPPSPPMQHPRQRDIYASAPHENTAEKAIYRIVEMGFTAEQAREALRMTDLGDGLRVDRAVEMLICREEGGERVARIDYV